MPERYSGVVRKLNAEDYGDSVDVYAVETRKWYKLFLGDREIVAFTVDVSSIKDDSGRRVLKDVLLEHIDSGNAKIKIKGERVGPLIRNGRIRIYL